jgi:type II secretory pathway pseudopilin PulG
MTNRKRNRGGITLVEVVVVIIIILVLAALLLPSVRRSRVPARRAQCKSHLKQIAVSLHNYHDVYSTLPPGWIATKSESHSSGFGWGFSILPYIDQADLYEEFDSRQPLADQSSGNAKHAATVISAYICPSDAGMKQAASQWIPKVGTTNYVGNFGVGIPVTYRQESGQVNLILAASQFQGVFGANSSIPFREISDGTSNTILVGERCVPESGVDWPIGGQFGDFNSYWSGIPNFDNVSPLSVVATATGMQSELHDESDLLNSKGDLNGLAGPNGIRSLPLFGINRGGRGEFAPSREESSSVSAGFSSAHVGGAHVLLCDGAVKFFSQDVDPIVFANLMRRADDRPLGDF